MRELTFRTKPLQREAKRRTPEPQRVVDPLEGKRFKLSRKNPLLFSGYAYNKSARGKGYLRASQAVEGRSWNYYRLTGRDLPMVEAPARQSAPFMALRMEELKAPRKAHFRTASGKEHPEAMHALMAAHGEPERRMPGLEPREEAVIGAIRSAEPRPPQPHEGSQAAAPTREPPAHLSHAGEEGVPQDVPAPGPIVPKPPVVHLPQVIEEHAAPRIVCAVHAREPEAAPLHEMPYLLPYPLHRQAQAPSFSHSNVPQIAVEGRNAMEHSAGDSDVRHFSGEHRLMAAFHQPAAAPVYPEAGTHEAHRQVRQEAPPQPAGHAVHPRGPGYISSAPKKIFQLRVAQGAATEGE